MIVFTPDIPVEIIANMQDLEVFVMATATFECVFNKENLRPTWIHGDIPMKKSERHQMRTRFAKQQLIINDCQLSDAGNYICEVEGIQSLAQLVVKGMTLNHLKVKQILQLN